MSYSGNNYVAITQVNHTTTPGTDARVWQQVPNSIPVTSGTCAFYTAASYARTNSVSTAVKFGGSYYTIDSLVEPIDGNGNDDQFGVSLFGVGTGATKLVYGGTVATPVINRPTGGGNSSSVTVRDMTIDGGGTASAIFEMSTLNQSYFEDLAVGHIAPGSDHVVEFGRSGGDGFQVFPTNINIGIYPDNGIMNCGVFTANVVGGSITSYTVNSGGNCSFTERRGRDRGPRQGIQGRKLLLSLAL